MKAVSFSCKSLPAVVLLTLFAVSAVGCGARTARVAPPRPFPEPSSGSALPRGERTVQPTVADAAASMPALLVDTALSLRGTPYDLGLDEIQRRSLEAWERGQPFYARVDAGGAMIGLRVVAADEPPAGRRVGSPPG